MMYAPEDADIKLSVLKLSFFLLSSLIDDIEFLSMFRFSGDMEASMPAIQEEEDSAPPAADAAPDVIDDEVAAATAIVDEALAAATEAVQTPEPQMTG